MKKIGSKHNREQGGVPDVNGPMSVRRKYFLNKEIIEEFHTNVVAQIRLSSVLTAGCI